MKRSEQSRLSPSKKRQQEQQQVSYKMLMRLYKVFGSHYKKHWKPLVVACFGLFLSVLITLLAPWPLKLLLDYVILGKPWPEKAASLTQWFGPHPEWALAALVLAFIVLQVLDSVASYLHKVGMQSVGEMLVTDVREQIFAHLQQLSLSFRESVRSGDLVYRLTSDVGDIKTILVEVPQNFAYRLIVLFSHVGLMLALEWRLALVTFSVIPILLYVNRRVGRGVQKATKKKKSKDSDMSALIVENVTAMALVQAYGREDWQQARFASENRQSLDSGIAAIRLSKAFNRSSDILVACSTAGAVYYGGSLALDGTIFPGTLVLFAAYLKSLYKPLEKVTDMLLEVAKSQVAGARLLELVECDMVMQDTPKAVPAPPLTGRVEFQDVSFGYQPGVAVLKHLNFVVEPGKTMALVGHSGAGKSTLISLLLRFYDPQQGRILIDGRELREYTLKSLRGQMTVVMQEARLFNQTVRENIGFGKVNAIEEEIVQAAKLAQAHDFIMEMPEGYETLISEGGNNLSGGQKQRLNIARAIIRDTPILILDEPATALDTKAEAKISAALHELTRSKTTFIIAHKFSTIAHADKILVLGEGKLAAYGTHEELLRTSQDYRELYELQFGQQLEYTTVATEAMSDNG